jgi:hypothetical protein
MHSRLKIVLSKLRRCRNVFQENFCRVILSVTKPLYVLPGDITQGLITKNWEQVASYEVTVVT